ncbi:asialoglycoprotein receptor 1-like [Asterias rubens]|uniref:asialoglycoprotein receptor 1-like n=1 Tax=Asterias rubens TaxID=7604 RepID=UPI001455BC92|nr:asialoglycoprotein receptor 1-like [Asterias rubens]
MVTKGVFAARGCPYGWVPYAESCYLGLDGSMEGDWSTAVMQCDRNNASIMVPSSDWENKYILTSFQHHGSLKGVWIDCNDAKVEGEWNCYEDGKYPTEYRKWEPDQPDDEKWPADDDYGFMITRTYHGKNPEVLGYWGDADATHPDKFIVCERRRQARCG